MVKKLVPKQENVNARAIESEDLRAKNVLVQPFGTADPAPAIGGKGQLFYNTGSNEVKVYDGSAWRVVGGGGSSDAARDFSNVVTTLVLGGDETLTTAQVLGGHIRRANVAAAGDQSNDVPPTPAEIVAALGPAAAPGYARTVTIRNDGPDDILLDVTAAGWSTSDDRGIGPLTGIYIPGSGVSGIATFHLILTNVTSGSEAGFWYLQSLSHAGARNAVTNVPTGGGANAGDNATAINTIIGALEDFGILLHN